jgi:hypothetical protein
MIDEFPSAEIRVETARRSETEVIESIVACA